MTPGIFLLYSGRVPIVGFALRGAVVSRFRSTVSRGVQKGIRRNPMVRIPPVRLVNRRRGLFVPGNRVSRGLSPALAARFFRCRMTVLLCVRLRQQKTTAAGDRGGTVDLNGIPCLADNRIFRIVPGTRFPRLSPVAGGLRLILRIADSVFEMVF